jgi:hypothetical protein
MRLPNVEEKTLFILNLMNNCRLYQGLASDEYLYPNLPQVIDSSSIDTLSILIRISKTSIDVTSEFYRCISPRFKFSKWVFGS